MQPRRKISCQEKLFEAVYKILNEQRLSESDSCKELYSRLCRAIDIIKCLYVEMRILQEQYENLHEVILS
jgi:hypothetical protein